MYFKEQKILDKAISTLTEKFPLNITWEDNTNRHALAVDGFITLQDKRLAVEVKNEARMYQFGQFIAQKEYYESFILIAENISDKIKEKLREAQINYLDTAGNAFVFCPPTIAIAIDGKKREKKEHILVDRAFTKTGMQLVFAYLIDAALLNKPYREIAKKVNISLDTITKTNISLKKQGYLKQNNDELILTNKKKLIEKWADNYETQLKPKFFYEKFSFLNKEAEKEWKNTPLSKQACWGGEAAADIHTNFLRPTVFTLYTTETKAEIMRQYRFKPDTKGNIEVYFPFTNIDLIKEDKCTNLLLTYIDLINSGDARNIEIAQKIYDKYDTIFF